MLIKKLITIDLKIRRFRLKLILPIRCVEEILVGLSDMMALLKHSEGFIRIDKDSKVNEFKRYLEAGIDIPYVMLVEARKGKAFDLVDVHVKDGREEVKVKVRVG